MWTLFHVSLLCSVCCCFGEGRSLLKGQLAYKVDFTSPYHNAVTVTNGAFVVKATVSNVNSDVTSCRVIASTEESQKIMGHKTTILETVGIDKINVLLERCQELERRARRIDQDSTFNHNLTVGQPFTGDFTTGVPAGNGSQTIIYPGTKWCGISNVAVSIDDLGVHNRTDACCRTHDHCPYYIKRFESKYNYYNGLPWSLSHCECDQHLYNCLKSVNTTTSNGVGKMMFELLNRCFTFEESQYCADGVNILSSFWCTNYKTGQMAVMHEGHKWTDDVTGSPAAIVG